MNPRIGWLLAAVFTLAAWRAYGWHGLAFAASAIVFWLLLQFNRAVRVMKNAAAGAARPRRERGDVPRRPCARHDDAADRDAKTKSLGRKVEGSDDDWRWSDDGGASVVLHFERGQARCLADRAARGAGDLESIFP